MWIGWNCERVISVETIIHDELNFILLLSNEQKERCVQISAQLLDCYESEGDTFLCSLITCDGTWIQYFMPAIKKANTEWWHKDLPPLRGKLWLVFFGTLRVSYSLIFLQYSEPSVHFIIWSFLKSK
jgi:hypothetical protein